MNDESGLLRSWSPAGRPLRYWVLAAAPLACATLIACGRSEGHSNEVASDDQATSAVPQPVDPMFAQRPAAELAIVTFKDHSVSSISNAPNEIVKEKLSHGWNLALCKKLETLGHIKDWTAEVSVILPNSVEFDATPHLTPTLALGEDIGPQGPLMDQISSLREGQRVKVSGEVVGLGPNDDDPFGEDCPDSAGVDGVTLLYVHFETVKPM